MKTSESPKAANKTLGCFLSLGSRVITCAKLDGGGQRLKDIHNPL